TLAGISCVAVGLLFAVIARMMLPLLKKREPLGLLMMLAVFVAIGLIRWPLPTVLLVSIPVSILLTVLKRRWSRA
ncbi:MAG: chromate transporter, partial [Hyphomicrobiales bacterium]|nr:chromate transporter [Hyphomicrobiales bacterium]